MGNLRRLRQRDRSFGMAFGTGGFIPAVAFEARLLRRPERGRVVGIMVNIVVASRAGIPQLVDMEPMGNRDIEGVDFGRGLLHLKNMGVAANAVWIDLVEFGREACMFCPALERKDVDAWHECMTGRVTLGTVDLRVEGRLLPERGFLLLAMAGETKFLLRRRVGGQGDGGIKDEYRQNGP